MSFNTETPDFAQAFSDIGEHQGFNGGAENYTKTDLSHQMDSRQALRVTGATTSVVVLAANVACAGLFGEREQVVITPIAEAPTNPTVSYVGEATPTVVPSITLEQWFDPNITPEDMIMGDQVNYGFPLGTADSLKLHVTRHQVITDVLVRMKQYMMENPNNGDVLVLEGNEDLALHAYASGLGEVLSDLLAGNPRLNLSESDFAYLAGNAWATANSSLLRNNPNNDYSMVSGMLNGFVRDALINPNNFSLPSDFVTPPPFAPTPEITPPAVVQE